MLVNQEREKTAQQIADVLNNCEMLFSLEISKRGSNYSLSVSTDVCELEYKESSHDGMNWFLSKLKMKVSNKEDIDELLEEIEYMKLH